jgi:hypothetical protein
MAALGRTLNLFWRAQLMPIGTGAFVNCLISVAACFWLSYWHWFPAYRWSGAPNLAASPTPTPPPSRGSVCWRPPATLFRLGWFLSRPATQSPSYDNVRTCPPPQPTAACDSPPNQQSLPCALHAALPHCCPHTLRMRESSTRHALEWAASCRLAPTSGSMPC